MHTEYLDTSVGKIAYQNFNGISEVGIVFMTGLASEMVGKKSEYIRAFCEEKNISFTRFDYFGHGMSEGEFLDGNISRWTQNASDVLENIAVGKRILIGSSMSGWMMFLLAKKFPDKIKGLIGIAAAPDFTEDFRKGLTPENKKGLEDRGYFIFTRNQNEKLLITKTLLEDGQKNLILDKEMKVACPVVLLHGLADNIVSYQKSIELAECIDSPRIEVRILKDADHSMSDPISLIALKESIKAILPSGCGKASCCSKKA